MLEERSRIVENLCKSFFPGQDNKIFLAESYLIKSREEKDDREKSALIEKGILMFGNNSSKHFKIKLYFLPKKSLFFFFPTTLPIERPFAR